MTKNNTYDNNKVDKKGVWRTLAIFLPLDSGDTDNQSK